MCPLAQSLDSSSSLYLSNFLLLHILLVDHDVTPLLEGHPRGKSLQLLVWMGGLGNGGPLWTCCLLYSTDRCGIRYIHHGPGDVIIHSSFNIDKVKHLLRSLAHSLREVQQLVADIFLESVALPLAHHLDLLVFVAREGEGVPSAVSE